MEKDEFIKIERDFIEKYTRTNYRVIGKYKHTAIKPCYWLEQKLLTGRENRNCYKGYWGIKSELCIQNSPSYPFCNHNCVFCWRETSGNLDTKFTVQPDDPEYLISELIRHQKNLVQHNYPLERFIQNFHVMKEVIEIFWKGLKVCLPCQIENGRTPLLTTDEISKKLNPPKSRNILSRAILLLKNTSVLKTDDLSNYYLSRNASNILKETGGDVIALLDKLVTNENDIKAVHERAMNPKHAAISLDGEPTFYPYIGEFINGFRKRGFTTFIVTNGTTPEVISLLNETGNLPSQLYITIPPPDMESYLKICRPRIKETREKIQKTLNMVKSLDTRTVLRITSVKHLNIKDEMIKGYIDLINEVQPNFLDIKGFTLEGASLNISERIGNSEPGSYYFPDFKYLLSFAQNLAEQGDFEIIEIHEKSRDILFRINWPEEKSIIITHDQI
ncbi:MAG: radical SAM protein [archaeon]|nr:radical SAM protein [archaeon]